MVTIRIRVLRVRLDVIVIGMLHHVDEIGSLTEHHSTAARNSGRPLPVPIGGSVDAAYNSHVAASTDAGDAARSHL